MKIGRIEIKLAPKKPSMFQQYLNNTDKFVRNTIIDLANLERRLTNFEKNGELAESELSRRIGRLEIQPQHIEFKEINAKIEKLEQIIEKMALILNKLTL